MRTIIQTFGFLIAIMAIATVLVFWAEAAQAQGSIILLVDASSSMEVHELNLQLESYERAMTGVAGLYGVNVEVVIFQDSPVLISSGDNIAAQAAFAAYPRLAAENRGSTCLADALDFVEIMIPTLPQPVVLDISGDGDSNCGRRDEIPAILDRIAGHGVQINTLFINPGSPPGAGPDFIDPYSFYQGLTRNGGFTILANGFQEFELSLFDKLTLELAYLE